MATASGVNLGKTRFVEDYLGRDMAASPDAVNRAWAEAGKPDSISESLVRKTRTRLKLGGKPGTGGSAKTSGASAKAEGRSSEGTKGGAKSSKGAKGQGKASEGAAPVQKNGRSASARAATPSSRAAASKSSSGDRERLVDEVEAGIDHLMFTLKVNGGMPEVEAALRAARRLLTRGGGGD